MKPNPRSRESLLGFFEEYHGLTTNQLAIVADVAPCTITDWKRKCGILASKKPKKPQKSKPGQKSKPSQKPKPPKNWDNKEWFENAYEEMGLRAIGSLINKDWKFVAGRLKKYGIRVKSHSERVFSDNPCCDEDWLYYHYCDRKQYVRWCKKNRTVPCEDGGQRLTLHECADLAGVSHQTIANWLSHFKIKTRDLSESKLGKSTKPHLTPEAIRGHRDRFFEQYRAGTINIIIGPNRFSNGVRVGKEETVAKRFNRDLRRTSTHTPS